MHCRLFHPSGHDVLRIEKKSDCFGSVGLIILTFVLYVKITNLIILFKTLLKDGKIEYDGDSWFFTYEDSHKIDQIKKNQHVNLIYQTDDMLFIECTGNGEIF